MSSASAVVTTPKALHRTRKHVRFEVDIAIDCTTKHLFLSNHVSNISRGGLFIQSPTPMPLDAEVSLVLRLPGYARPILAKGRVVWNYDVRKGTSRIVPGSGIRFVDIPAGDRAVLEDYLSRLSARQP
jgi:uncharacterized protein (TIGR02266 family)